MRARAPEKRVSGSGEATRSLGLVAGGAGLATDDDVSITNGGRRFDSAQALLVWVDLVGLPRGPTAPDEPPPLDLRRSRRRDDT